MVLKRVLLVGLLLAALSFTLIATAQDATPEVTPEATDVPDQGLANTIQGSAVITETLPFDESYLDRLQLPDGFSVNIFAQGLGNVRWFGIAPDGTIFVTRRQEGDVIALTDADGDGTANSTEVNVVLSDLPFVHGIYFNGNQVYLATDTRVYVSDWTGGAVLSPPRELVSGLPDAGQHPNRTLAVSPEGDWLYITVGSNCNACLEPNPEAATIIRVRLDGSDRQIYAQGLRNTIGFGWHPVTGDLWGLDHGSDWRGDDQPPEELNRLVADAHYGWPFCFADRQPDLYIPAPPPGGVGRAAFCQRTVPPDLTYTAHSAPIGMVFYTGTQFPADYANDAFVAMRGSWNRSEPSGYKIVRLVFDDNGQPTEFQDFLTGFLIPEQIANIGRVAGLAVAPDGSLLIAEDTNGVIYRVSYNGGS